MDLSSSTFQPRKKRKISFKKSKFIHYSPRHPSTDRILKRKTPRKPSKPILKHEVEPWWIGQRIIIQVPTHKNATKYRGKEASIRDYDPSTKLTHIWYETKQNNVENIDLTDLDGWKIANSKPLNKQIEFVPDNNWIPFYWKLGQRVMVRFDGKHGNGLKFEAFIDGFDPISRRHHINYGDTTEWIWATKERVQIYKYRCADYIETKLERFEDKQYHVTSPPWNPSPYGLDATFATKSKEIEERRKGNMNIIQLRNNITQPQKKIFGNKTAPRRFEQIQTIEGRPISRLMKTVRCTNTNVEKIMSSNTANRNKRKRKKTRLTIASKENIENDLTSIQSLSSETTVDTKRCQNGSDTYTESSDESKNKQNSEAIQVSVTTNIVVTNNTTRARSVSLSKTKSLTKRKKISLRIPTKSRKSHVRKMSVNTKIINNENKLKSDTSALQHTKHSKYPRNPVINGGKWKRHYSGNDRKYYWLLVNDSGDILEKEWDPWRKNGEKAPWMTSMQHWGKFMDNQKKEYYYNYSTKESTFDRPKCFESDAEIKYDSADN